MGAELDVNALPLPLERLYKWWITTKGFRRFPDREEFDPLHGPLSDPAVLECLMIIEPAECLNDYRFLVCGKEAITVFGSDNTMQKFQDVQVKVNRGQSELGYALVHAMGEPDVFEEQGFEDTFGITVLPHKRLLLPLGPSDCHARPMRIIGGITSVI